MCVEKAESPGEEKSRMKIKKSVVYKRRWDEIQPHTEWILKFSWDLLENIHHF